jgi:phosphinothricin acetyltransferase
MLPTSSSLLTVRQAQETDLSAVCDIINHFIRTTTVNFRTQPQAVEEWRAEWGRVHEQYPWLVAVHEEEVLGIAYAGPWKARNAYDWCAEVTVYVALQAHRRGVARTLYEHLLPILDAQGYRTMVGVIGLPNDPSVALHEACGFEHAGTLRGVGFKMGEWHDVGFWQRRSSSAGLPPGPIRPVAAVQAPTTE